MDELVEELLELGHTPEQVAAMVRAMHSFYSKALTKSETAEKQQGKAEDHECI